MRLLFAAGGEMLLGTVRREMYLEISRELSELSISARMRLMCHRYSSLSSNVRIGRHDIRA